VLPYYTPAYVLSLVLRSVSSLISASCSAAQGSSASLGTSTVLRVEQAEKEFVFEDVYAKPVPSLLRNFSAPVKMTVLGQTEEDLAHMLAHDTDPVNRWE